MIVLDASAAVEALVGAAPDAQLWEALRGDVAAPHLLDIEVLSALRGLSLAEKLAASAAERAWRELSALHVQRFDASALAERIWTLRHQFTAYDAAYIALAEGLSAPLLTCDAKLAAAGHAAEVRVVGGGRR